MSGFSKSGEVEFGGVSLEEEDKFDYLILLLFEPDFNVKYVYKIPFDSVVKHETAKTNKGGITKYIIRLNNKRINNLKNDSCVENLLDSQ